MKILFILDRLNLGGAERHSLNLSKQLAQRGHEINIIVLFSGGSENFPIVEFPSEPKMLNLKSMMSVHSVLRLKTEIAEENPDIVIAINQTALAAATFARLVGCNIKNLCCRFSTTKIPTVLGKLKLPVFKWCTARSDALIFVSKLQRQYWEKQRMRSKLSITIQNGIDQEHFIPAAHDLRKKIRHGLGIRENETVFTLVGRLDREKNHSWIMRVLSELNKNSVKGETLPIRLLFVGEGPLKGNLQKKSIAYGVEEQVIFAGGHNDIRPFLAASDTGILISCAIETFSNAALEQMSSGLPMIMTNIGGAREIIEQGNEGFLVEVDDDAALKKAMLRLVDQKVRLDLGNSARMKILRSFTFNRMVDQYEDLLRELVDRKPCNLK